jgi:hypothetical protein
MDEDVKTRHAGLKRKLAALTEDGADEAKLNELKTALAGLEETEEALPPGPRLIPSKPEPEAKVDESPKTAEPRPLSRREQTDKAASKAKDEAKPK